MRWCVEVGGSDCGGGGGGGGVGGGGGGEGDAFLVGCRWLPRASGTKKCLKSTYGHLN